MCAIAGHVSFSAPPDEARVHRMQRRLAHRGPDGEGRVVTARACIAHNRLALLDLATGEQPMRSPDGRHTLTFNGEIYNWRELREELRHAWDFRTRSDAEVLLAALITWGEAALPKLNGMFAFFWWDDTRERGFAARDRFGVKPFAYLLRAGELAFASEAQALAAAFVERPRFCAEALLEVLVAPCFSGVERPLFDGLAYLQPGEQLTFDRDGCATKRWWTLPRLQHAPAAERDAAAHVERVRVALGDATAATLRADVPVGIYLSGGLDSSLLAAFATRAGVRPHGFTIAFDAQAHFDYERSAIVVADDEPYARAIADELRLEREVVRVSRDTLADDLGALARANDALCAWEQELAQHHLARAAARRVKAILVGDAADETHWGYHFLLDDAAIAHPREIVRRHGGVPILRERLPDPVAHFGAKYAALCENAGLHFGDRDAQREATAYLVNARWLPRLLHNGDIHAMASGVEARVPFADNAVTAAAFAVPPSLAWRDGREKWVLRQVARGLLPEAIVQRRKSALPKDQLTQAVYQSEAKRTLTRHRGLLAEFIDIPAAAALTERPLAERERAALFRIICVGHFVEHHGVVG